MLRHRFGFAVALQTLVLLMCGCSDAGMAPAPARIAVSGPVLTKSGNGAKQHIELTVRGRHLAIDIDDSGASVGGGRFAFTSQKRKDAFLTGIAVFTASSRATHNSIKAPPQSRGLTGVLS